MKNKAFILLAVFSFFQLRLSAQETENALPGWFYTSKSNDIVAIGVSDIGLDSAMAIEQAVFRAKTILSFLNHSVAGTFVSTNLGVYNESYYYSSTDMELLHTVNYFGVLTDSNKVTVTDTFFTDYKEAVVRAFIENKPYDTSASVVFASKISRQVGVEKANRQFVCTHDRATLSSLSEAKEKQYYEIDLISNLYESLFSNGIKKVKQTSLNRNCSYPVKQVTFKRNINSLDAGLNCEVQNGLWPAIFSSFVKNISLYAGYYNSSVNLLSSTDIKNRDGNYQSDFNESLQSAKNYNVNNFSFKPLGISITSENNLEIGLQCMHDGIKINSGNTTIPTETIHSKQLKEYEKENWQIYNNAEFSTLISYSNYVALHGNELSAIESKGEAMAYNLHTATLVALELAKLNTARRLNSSVVSSTNSKIDTHSEIEISGKSIISQKIAGFNKEFLIYKPAQRQMIKARVHLFYIPEN